MMLKYNLSLKEPKKPYQRQKFWLTQIFMKIVFLADYDVTYAPDKELIEERIADAERFIRRMERYVASNKIWPTVSFLLTRLPTALWRRSHERADDKRSEAAMEDRNNIREAIELFLEDADPIEVEQRVHDEQYVSSIEVAVG